MPYPKPYSYQPHNLHFSYWLAIVVSKFTSFTNAICTSNLYYYLDLYTYLTYSLNPSSYIILHILSFPFLFSLFISLNLFASSPLSLSFHLALHLSLFSSCKVMPRSSSPPCAVFIRSLNSLPSSCLLVIIALIDSLFSPFLSSYMCVCVCIYIYISQSIS